MSAIDVPIDETISFEMLDRDPASVYQRLRRECPVVHVKAINRILLTKADHVYQAKTDMVHFGSEDDQTPMQRAFGGHTLMRKDGAAHLTERSAMVETFKVNHWVCDWKARFEQFTDEALGKLPASGDVELRDQFAAPLVARILNDLLGIAPESDAQLFDWAKSLITGAMNASFDEKVFATSDKANAEMDACFDGMIERHRAQPNPSVLSVMANAADPLPLSQIRTNMKICIGGAAIEMRDALLTVLHGLLQHPDQLAACQHGGRWDLACEEGLRWVAPIQASPRIVKKEIVLDGVRLPAGETIMAVQASANYDEDYWQRPEQFNIHRPFAAHQSFGAGPHRCMGENIYRRIMAGIVLPKFFARFPHAKSASDINVEFRGFAFRGPTSLPVSLS
ncbi:cytochrome P450 [Maritalea mediterranea]|uniref:Cytochrome P450 n=1 Tax=Maritalea mediterranea TaxID=2909667 RepID=A0ABS9EAV9_9HYPH|nr:cytochrome P450 [Maritalea mediterranea]MCF4099324.1 cytochrome P450 [Maritalea mediterranea]